MELGKLETKTGAETGAPLHLRHPALGHLLYSGKDADATGAKTGPDCVPVHVILRGSESHTVTAKSKASRNSKSKNAETDELGMSFLCSLVIAFEGITKDGKPMEATDENKRTFFEQSDGLGEQVLAFATDRANFFGEGAKP